METKLPVIKIFLKALSLPALYQRELFKVGTPLLIVGLIVIVFQHLGIGGEDTYLDEVINGVFMTCVSVALVMAIVGCHRVFILGPDSVIENTFISWTGNEIKYVGWWVLIGLAAALISMPLISLFSPLLDNSFDGYLENKFYYYVVFNLISIPIYYIVSRWSLLLPASATDTHGKNFSWSWHLSDGNGWRLTFLIGFLPFCLDLLFELLPDYEAILFQLLTSAIWLVVGVIEIGLLSLSYSFLKSVKGTKENG